MTNRREFLTALTAAGIATSGLVPADAAMAADARFTIRGDDFLLDGQPFHIMAGEMHYPRIPRELWRDRLKKLKSLGLNTLCT
jgi:beta-galactosidase